MLRISQAPPHFTLPTAQAATYSRPQFSDAECEPWGVGGGEGEWGGAVRRREDRLGFQPEQPASDSIFFVLFGARVLPRDSGWPRTQDLHLHSSPVCWDVLPSPDGPSSFLSFSFPFLPPSSFSLSPSFFSLKILLYVYRCFVFVEPIPA